MSQATEQLLGRNRIPLIITLVVLGAVVAGFFFFATLYTEVLWFDQLGFLQVLFTSWGGTAIMFALGFFGMFIPVWLSIQIAYRFRPVYAKLSSELDRYRQLIDPLRRVAMIGLPALLGLFSGLSASTTWPQFLLWMNRSDFGTVDPEFGLDVSFYVFELPVFTSVVAFASSVLFLCCSHRRCHRSALWGSVHQRPRGPCVAHHAYSAGANRFALFPGAGC